MAKNQFAEPHFHNETAARAWFEAARWPNGPICPKCKSAKHYATKKAGVYRCAASTCRKDFTVMTGTVMERSHAKLTQWAAAFHLAASSKKGFSAHHLHRELGCQYNTAWFLHHRVMEAMRRGGLDLPRLGGEGQVVEADETYFGQQENPQPSPKRKGRPYTKGGKSGPSGKRMVIALVERGGNIRAFHPARADGTSVNAIVRQNIARESRLHTDESRLYLGVGQEFSAHEAVKRTANMCAATFTPILLKDFSRFSNAGCAAFISTVRRSTCTDTLPNSTSGITTAPRSVTTILTGRLLRFAAAKASALLTINLTKPNFKFQAARFLRWRRKRR